MSMDMGGCGGMPPVQDGKGKGKPHYLSHVPDNQLSAYGKHAGSENSMSHTNLMSKKGSKGNGQEGKY